MTSDQLAFKVSCSVGCPGMTPHISKANLCAWMLMITVKCLQDTPLAGDCINRRWFYNLNMHWPFSFSIFSCSGSCSAEVYHSWLWENVEEISTLSFMHMVSFLITSFSNIYVLRLWNQINVFTEKARHAHEEHVDSLQEDSSWDLNTEPSCCLASLNRFPILKTHTV